MLKPTFAFVAMCALAALAGRGAEPDPEPPVGNAELLKLKGTWSVTQAVGNKRELKAPPGLTYTFDGDKLTHTAPLGKGNETHTRKYKVKIDTKKKPYKITMTPEGKDKGLVGIYKIEKGVLHLAMGKGGKPPADFSGDGAVAFEMKQEKGKK
jgi:uncharacterized protein (TIGR03067 family)